MKESDIYILGITLIWCFIKFDNDSSIQYLSLWTERTIPYYKQEIFMSILRKRKVFVIKSIKNVDFQWPYHYIMLNISKNEDRKKIFIPLYTEYSFSKY